MGSRSGVNTFSGYQDEKRRRRVELIGANLSTLSALRLRFSNITQLAEVVALHISQKETEAGIGVCSASTLLRNLHYKALLIGHLNSQAQKEGKKTGESLSSQTNTDVQRIQAQLRCVNLENENDRLKSYIVQLETKLSNKDGHVLNVENGFRRDEEVALANLREDFAQTCKTLVLLLQRFEGYAAVDGKSCSIVDSAIKRGEGRVIAGPDEAGAFYRWLAANPFFEIKDRCIIRRV